MAVRIDVIAITNAKDPTFAELNAGGTRSSDWVQDCEIVVTAAAIDATCSLAVASGRRYKPATYKTCSS